MSPEDLGESRVDFCLYPRCQGEEIVRDPGGSDIKTQELFFDSVLLDVFRGIDGTQEVAMQVEESLRQTRRDRGALDGSSRSFVWPQRFLPASSGVRSYLVLRSCKPWAYASLQACPATSNVGRSSILGRPHLKRALFQREHLVQGDDDLLDVTWVVPGQRHMHEPVSGGTRYGRMVVYRAQELPARAVADHLDQRSPGIRHTKKGPSVRRVQTVTTAEGPSTSAAVIDY